MPQRVWSWSCGPEAFVLTLTEHVHADFYCGLFLPINPWLIRGGCDVAEVILGYESLILSRYELWTIVCQQIFWPSKTWDMLPSGLDNCCGEFCPEATGDDLGYCAQMLHELHMFSIALAMLGLNINFFTWRRLDATPAWDAWSFESMVDCITDGMMHWCVWYTTPSITESSSQYVLYGFYRRVTWSLVSSQPVTITLTKLEMIGSVAVVEHIK